MHMHKTGALIRAAVLLGARCGACCDAATLASLDHYAKSVGLAFQVVDDILDTESSTATLGKTAGKDAAHNKPTYVSVMGVEGARRKAADLHDSAVTALGEIGPSAQRLIDLADFIIQRKF
jgi:farnesyl diphosphate synthase